VQPAPQYSELAAEPAATGANGSKLLSDESGQKLASLWVVIVGIRPAQQVPGLVRRRRPRSQEQQDSNVVHRLFAAEHADVVAPDCGSVRSCGRSEVLPDAGAVLVTVGDLEQGVPIPGVRTSAPPPEGQPVPAEYSISGSDVGRRQRVTVREPTPLDPDVCLFAL
jgi:hypothetical protein